MKPTWNTRKFAVVCREILEIGRPGIAHEAAWLRFSDWLGRPCTVYAERMIPRGEKLPCVLHAVGGGQTVRTEDLSFWADQGYACASFDWQIGDVQPREPERTSQWPESVRLQHGPHESLDQCILPLAIQAAQVALSWLMDHPATDPSKAGMSGISWGGYLTWATAAYDTRIRATCPVFGCGIFDIPEMPELFADEVRSYWETHWDPQALTAKQTAPAAYLSASNDFFGNVAGANELLSRLSVDSRWSLLPDADHAIGPGESALARAWMAHHLKGAAAIPGAPRLDTDMRVTCDESQTITSVDLWWTNSTTAPRFASWNSSPIDSSAQMAFAKVTYDDGLSLCSPLVYLSEPIPAKPIGDQWPSLPDGIGWRWELGSTQFHSNAVSQSVLDHGRRMVVTPAPCPHGGPVALLIHTINDQRWKLRPGDVLKFCWEQKSPIEKISALLTHTREDFKQEHEVVCPLIDGLYQIELPASMEWCDVLSLRLHSHGRREAFTFGDLQKSQKKLS